MKYDGSWWGVWLVAEDEGEGRLLRDLYAAIKGQASGYERGEPCFQEEADDDDGVPAGALVLPR